MRKSCLILLMCLICLTATACGNTGEVEDQAYALVMGVDRASDGGIELTIRIPRIGHGVMGDETSGGKDEPYLLIAAAGRDYAQAMENLQWSVSRELNLSHLRLLTVSEALASDTRFPALSREIAETRHLYTTAGFVVCEGQARSFIEGQETLLGNHLASDIDAMLRHYVVHGYIPAATFADLYYATQSCYSDPTGIWAFPDSGEQPASAVIESDEALLNAETKTSSSRQYLGAALFRDGRLAGQLDARETLCLNLITRRVDAFGFEAGGATWTLSSVRAPHISARRNGDAVRLNVDVYLTSADTGDLSAPEAAVTRALERLIAKCQRLRVEPFGFAARVASRFPTLTAWQAFNWRERFPESAIAVKVHISGPK